MENLQPGPVTDPTAWNFVTSCAHCGKGRGPNVCINNVGKYTDTHFSVLPTTCLFLTYLSYILFRIDPTMAASISLTLLFLPTVRVYPHRPMPWCLHPQEVKQHHIAL